MEFSFFQENKKCELTNDEESDAEERLWILGYENESKYNPPFIWRKVVPGRRVTCVLVSSPERSNFLCIPLRNVANSLHQVKEKVGSAFVMVRSTF